MCFFAAYILSAMPAIQKSKKEGKVYQNPIPTAQMKGGFFSILWEYMTSSEERVPQIPIGPFRTNAAAYRNPPASGLRITWMGHSSLLIEIDGKRFLTDPVTGSRASFVSFAGPKRFFDYPLPIAEWPALDGIILSHDHYDHLDHPTILQLRQLNTPFYCSLGVGQHLEKWGISKTRIVEMDWTDTVRVGSDCTITAAPARHFSGRGIINRNQTLWSSFVIRGNKHNIFFGADSGWFPGFSDIGEQFGPFDLTMLEVGAYGRGWPDIHMGPDNATNAHLALKGKVMMPIHWGTFDLALHAWREPVQQFEQLARQKNITGFMPLPGEPTEFTGEGLNTRWWQQ